MSSERFSRLSALRNQELDAKQKINQYQDDLRKLAFEMDSLVTRRNELTCKLDMTKHFLKNFGSYIYSSFDAKVQLPPEVIKIILAFYFKAEEKPLRKKEFITALRPYVSQELRIAASLFDPSFNERIVSAPHNFTNFIYCSHPMALPVLKRPKWVNFIEKDSLKEIAACFTPVVIKTSLVKVTLYGPKAMLFFECKKYKEVLRILHSQHKRLVVARRQLNDLIGRGFSTSILGLIPGEEGFGIPWRKPTRCRCFGRPEDQECGVCRFKYVYNKISEKIILVDANTI